MDHIPETDISPERPEPQPITKEFIKHLGYSYVNDFAPESYDQGDVHGEIERLEAACLVDSHVLSTLYYDFGKGEVRYGVFKKKREDPLHDSGLTGGYVLKGAGIPRPY